MSGQELWNQIKEKLSIDQKVDQEIYNTYISSSKFIENQPNDFSLVVKTQFGVKVVEPFVSKIGDLVKEITNRYPLIDVVSFENYKKQNKFFKELNQNDKIDYEFSFEHFVTGPSNNQAYQAAKAVVENPGKWSPLFIFGDSGLGKTHLLHAIIHQFKVNHSNLKTYYLTSEEFGRKVVDALHQGHQQIEDLKKELILNDVLLIDDIQFLAKKEKTNEILFTIFNHFLENHKQLVFSSDKLPDQLNGFDTRLITRFNLGLTAPIKSLDFNTALAITEAEIQNQQIGKKVDNEVKSYIAKFFANDVRKIKGSITKINFWLVTNSINQGMDMNALKDLFKDVPTSNLGSLNVKKIKEVVADKYGVNVKLIDGRARVSNISNARHVSMYLTKEILGHSLIQIGAEFGGKDHTTVMSAIKKIESNILNNKEFKKQIEILKNEVLSK